MNSELYYCKPWTQMADAAGSECEYSVCVSPMIRGNPQGNVVQFHAGVFLDGRVVRLGEIGVKKCSNEREYIGELEQSIRAVVGTHLVWDDRKPDFGVVKIWYFDENDTGKPSFGVDIELLPLRFTVTAVNVMPVNEVSGIVRDSLEKALVEWLRTCLGYPPATLKTQG